MSYKRNLNDEDDDRPLKRVRTEYKNGSHSVSVQLTLNQLLNSSAMKEMSKKSNCLEKCLEKKCFNCVTNGQSVWICCNFCERMICSECGLNCLRCCHTYCRLCAVKCYEYSHENNLGLCLSCNT